MVLETSVSKAEEEEEQRDLSEPIRNLIYNIQLP